MKELLTDKEIKKHFLKEVEIYKKNNLKVNLKKIIIKALDSIWEEEIVPTLGSDVYYVVLKKDLLIFKGDNLNGHYEMPYSPGENYDSATFYITFFEYKYYNREFDFLKMPIKHFKKHYVNLMFIDIYNFMKKHDYFKDYLK